MMPPGAILPGTAAVMFCSTESVRKMPAAARSSGTKARPSAMASSGFRMLTALPLILTVPLVGRRDAEDGARDIGAAGADEAAEADDLALAHREADVGEDARQREVLDLERDVADRGALLVHVFLERPADHQADDVGVAEIARSCRSRSCCRRGRW